MKAKMRKPKERFYPIEITLEKKEEAEVLWAFLNLSGDKIREMLEKEYRNAPNRDRLTEATIDMFDALDNEFRPEWHNDC